jgi:hypothetical protein
LGKNLRKRPIDEEVKKEEPSLENNWAEHRAAIGIPN